VKQSSQTLARKPRSGISIVPFVGDLLRMTRLVRDPGAHWGYKLLVLMAIAYVVSPIDAVPEAIVPLVGFLDDVGLIVGLRLVLERQLAKYRYPLFADPPSMREEPRITVSEARYGTTG
jgi:uncharacterized membrane protein YkvA (DUF1232 family)